MAESYSDHPISRSLKEAWGKALDTARVGQVEELSGRGVRAQVDGKEVWAGNGKLMEEIGLAYRPSGQVAPWSTWRQRAGTWGTSSSPMR